MTALRRRAAESPEGMLQPSVPKGPQPMSRKLSVGSTEPRCRAQHSRSSGKPRTAAGGVIISHRFVTCSEPFSFRSTKVNDLPTCKSSVLLQQAGPVSGLAKVTTV
ncbi:hypothetical protein CYMTET_13572 [Cymbomonas tetramitiformis]|uniref:Uncharacterized protein n=1 Tax=Cymbomonas tetramitiformis TaxID=36881 RepID=A0AAE0GJC7_9CHLO|nr:hypothetical protein CYMTET_13572 [Cymbomonas tetramitiformis]